MTKFADQMKNGHRNHHRPTEGRMTGTLMTNRKMDQQTTDGCQMNHREQNQHGRPTHRKKPIDGSPKQRGPTEEWTNKTPTKTRKLDKKNTDDLIKNGPPKNQRSTNEGITDPTNGRMDSKNTHNKPTDEPLRINSTWNTKRRMDHGKQTQHKTPKQRRPIDR